jgi:hypothetical protein
VVAKAIKPWDPISFQGTRVDSFVAKAGAKSASKPTDQSGSPRSPASINR